MLASRFETLSDEFESVHSFESQRKRSNLNVDPNLKPRVKANQIQFNEIVSLASSQRHIREASLRRS